MAEPAVTSPAADSASFNLRVVQMLEDRFGLASPVAEPVVYLLEHPGKGLRPELAWAVADACGGGDETKVFAVAAAGELLHLASLIHDDMVDGAHFRRGQTAVHRKFDPRTAVLTGDYMLGAAYKLLSEDASEATLRRLGPAMHELAEAELLEVRARGQRDNLDLARRIALGKTGSLFGWIATATAIECREWAGQNAWDQWGRNLGLLFQLADDIGDELRLAEDGKDTGLDELTETPTVLAAHLLRDPRGGSLAQEVGVLIQKILRPPAQGKRLARFYEAITERAADRHRMLAERL